MMDTSFVAGWMVTLPLVIITALMLWAAIQPDPHQWGVESQPEPECEHPDAEVQYEMSGPYEVGEHWWCPDCQSDPRGV